MISVTPSMADIIPAPPVMSKASMNFSLEKGYIKKRRFRQGMDTMIPCAPLPQQSVVYSPLSST